MDKKACALIVIDMQKGLFNKAVKVYQEKELVENINLLTAAFHKNSINVFFIQHTNKNILSENTEDWQLHPGLNLLDDDIFLKKESSSIFKEKAIKRHLDLAGIKHIVICGLVTHGCVKAACQDGKKLGYNVTLASEAHSSYNKDAEQLISEWNKKLEDEGINVKSTEEILEQLINVGT